MAFFISKRFLITRRNVESVSIDNLWQEARNGNLDMSRGSTHVAYRILRRVTDRYTKLVEGIQSGLDEMEQEMFENPRDALLEDLIFYGRNLKRLRKICLPA
jgi:Mg2+ and Co2+ transporter CorA